MPQPPHDTHVLSPGQVFTGSWEHDLVSCLPANYAQQAIVLKAFARAHQIRCPEDLLRGILVYVLSTYSLRALSCWALLTDLADMSDRAWGKRLRQAGPWMQWVREELLKAPDVAYLLPRLPNDVRVLPVDASSLKQPGGNGDDWRLHLAYDLLRDRMAEVRLTDQHGSESLAHFHLRPGDVTVSDRGSGSRKNVATAEAVGAQTLMRFAPSTFPLCKHMGQPWMWSPGSMNKGKAPTFERRLLTEKAAALACRSLPTQAAESQRGAAGVLTPTWTAGTRRDALSGRIAAAGQHLGLQSVESKVLQLYRARWQIELIFKRLKLILQLHQVRSQHPPSVQATLFASLIAWALQEQEGHWLRAQLDALSDVILTTSAQRSPAPEERSEAACSESDFDGPEGPVSSWLVATLVLHTVQQAGIGQWTFARLRAVLPRLRRLLCGSHLRRIHQERLIRARLVSLFSPGSETLFICSSA